MIDDRLRDALPPAVQELAARGATLLQGEEGEWLLDIGPPSALIRDALPPGAVVIGNNGYGDFLFLDRQPGERRFSDVVHVYWHEGPEIAIYARDITALAGPAAQPSDVAVSYYDGAPVRLGDRVELRVWVRLFRKSAGVVVYVPGISKRRPQMEHSGLVWVGVQLDDGGTVIGSFVDPATHRLQKGVKLTGRGEPAGP